MSAATDVRSRAQAIYDRERKEIARAVGDVAAAWVEANNPPRVCVGDVAEAVLRAIEMVLEDGKSSRHDIPNLSLRTVIEPDGQDVTMLTIVAVIDRDPVSYVRLKIKNA